MMRLKSPIVAVILGEGGSGGALGIGVADRVLMLETRIIRSSARKGAPRSSGNIASTPRKPPKR